MERLATGYARAAQIVTPAFSASLAAGTLTCVIGSNGAGKSTLLRTMAGLEKPIAGSVVVMGRDISAMSRRELARRVGVVLTQRQPSALQMTVEELVSLGRTPYTGFLGRLSAADRQIIDEAIRTSGLVALRSRRLATLSDGERQKAMTARALAQQTPILLLDEPTAFLDFPSRVETFRTMRAMAHSTGKTVVAATHDLDAALHAADNLWVVRRGEAPLCGSPSQLAEAGSLDFLFDGRAARFDRHTLNYTIIPD